MTLTDTAMDSQMLGDNRTLSHLPETANRESQTEKVICWEGKLKGITEPSKPFDIEAWDTKHRQSFLESALPGFGLPLILLS